MILYSGISHLVSTYSVNGQLLSSLNLIESMSSIYIIGMYIYVLS